MQCAVVCLYYSLVLHNPATYQHLGWRLCMDIWLTRCLKASYFKRDFKREFSDGRVIHHRIKDPPVPHSVLNSCDVVLADDRFRKTANGGRGNLRWAANHTAHYIKQWQSASVRTCVRVRVSTCKCGTVRTALGCWPTKWGHFSEVAGSHFPSQLYC